MNEDFNRKLYNIFLGCVNHWRGVWSVLDYYTGIGWTTASVSLAVGVCGLIALRAFRNILAPPVVLIVDGPKDYFIFPTMFRAVNLYRILYI